MTDKDTLSEAFCEDTERDVLSILEILAIYYGFDKKPKIDGIRLVVVRPHEEWGRQTVFTRSEVTIGLIYVDDKEDIEVITVSSLQYAR